MGIEPKRTAFQSLEKSAFCEKWRAACDWRANFRVMRGNAGLRETTTPSPFLRKRRARYSFRRYACPGEPSLKRKHQPYPRLHITQ
jgi:hypothetical protein